MGNWLCHEIFEGPGAALAFTCDGFFALRLTPENTMPQDITGLWRLSADGLQLTLFNRQDQRLLFTVGKDGLYGAMGISKTLALVPSGIGSAAFTITGRLEKSKASARLTDALSGYAFNVCAPPEAEAEKFASAEIQIENGKVTKGKVLSHSKQVPRFYAETESRSGLKIFNSEVIKRYWLLPPFPGFERTALRFEAPLKSSELLCEGNFDITGKGLRLEDRYKADDEKLTLSLSGAELHNLKLLGAEELIKAVPGEFSWRLLPQGLELNGSRKLLLLANQS